MLEMGGVPAPRRNNRTRVRLSDVAAKVGVSPITISRALRHPEKVSPELRQQILRVIDEMGYVPDLAARALASRHSGVVSILAPDVNDHLFIDVMRGIEARMRDTGLLTQYANTFYAADYSAEQHQQQILSVLGQNPAGIIMVGPERLSEMGGLFAKISCPVTFILDQSQKPDRMAVAVNHEEAGAAATRFLFAKGYRRIGLIGGSLDTRQQQRAKGYERALREEGIFDPSLLCLEPEQTTVGLGCRLFGELMARAPDMDAVFCQNDDLALGVLFECQRLGIRVPEDLGICGVNDLDFAAFTHPPLTTISVPRYDLGFQAADMLVRAIESGESLDGRMQLDFTLVERETTR